jgi:hypothetical protein
MRKGLLSFQNAEENKVSKLIEVFSATRDSFWERLFHDHNSTTRRRKPAEFECAQVLSEQPLGERREWEAKYLRVHEELDVEPVRRETSGEHLIRVGMGITEAIKSLKDY